MMETCYDDMVDDLNDIYLEYADLQIERLRKNKHLVKTVIEETIIPKLCEECETFKTLFSRIFWGGSVYDKLRVKNPTEFDLDLVLVVPQEHGSITICEDNCPSGNVKIKLLTKTEQLSQNDEYKEFRKWLHMDGYLLGSRIRSWMQSTVVRVLDKVDYSTLTHLGITKMLYSQSGPAMTLKIYTNDVENQIDVDLVPVFEFDKSDWPMTARKYGLLWEQQLNAEDLKFFTVPKPSSKKARSECPLWRVGFQNTERKLLHNKKFLKKAIKLSKALRDKINRTEICSYHLKTIALWFIYMNPTFHFNDENSLGNVFMHLLSSLIDYLYRKNLPHFWFPSFNLWSGMSEASASNYYHELLRIRNAIKANHKIVLKYFPVEIETEEFNEDISKEPGDIVNQIKPAIETKVDLKPQQTTVFSKDNEPPKQKNDMLTELQKYMNPSSVLEEIDHEQPNKSLTTQQIQKESLSSKLEKYETDETRDLKLVELQRLVLLQQLEAARLQKEYYSEMIKNSNSQQNRGTGFRKNYNSWGNRGNY